MEKTLLTALALACSSVLFANPRLPKIFGDNMVLQRNHAIAVWGWADKGEEITVQLNKQTRSVRADKTGKWKAELAPEQAGGPYQLTVTGKSVLTINDVLVGDVWICSGQSNMEFVVANSDNAAEEMRHADFPQIRHFKVPNTISATPVNDIKGGEWKICDSATVGNFTAVGYFFARELYNQFHVPIGLINTSWGGTHVETWTSREAFQGSEEFRDMISQMPQLNLDSLSRVKSQAARQHIQQLQGSIDESPETIATWKEPAYNDSQWPRMHVPGVWEQQALGDVDGVVWFRKTIDIDAADAGREAVLDLAMVDDMDETYVNGVKVGSMVRYNEKRHYIVPAGSLKEGKNVIAVRVTDTGGGGGIYGDATDVKLTIGNNTMPLAGDWLYRVESVASGQAGIGPNSYPTLLFNAMVNPLIPYTIKGAIWYQGESNAGRAWQYRQSFPLMITDWRKRWGLGYFPFYFVQLATFNAANGNSSKGSTWAELREAQTATLRLPNTGMAVTTDIGNPKDIHPRNKQDVGRRLAAIAFHQLYGMNNVFEGPTYSSMRVSGNRATLSFNGLGSGLVTKDPYGYLKGFEIAGPDHQFHYAKALIEGNHVVVFQDGVTEPKAVRYGWADDASECNLFNKEGFPAAPFRTDNWNAVTADAKYRIGN